MVNLTTQGLTCHQIYSLLVHGLNGYDKYQYILSFGEEDKGEFEFCHFPVSVEFEKLVYLCSLKTDGQELAGDADPMEY